MCIRDSPQTVTGIIQDISGSTLGIMEADGGVYGFDTGILSGFDDSYQIGDTVTVTYEGDTMNPDSEMCIRDRYWDLWAMGSRWRRSGENACS